MLCKYIVMVVACSTAHLVARLHMKDYTMVYDDRTDQGLRTFAVNNICGRE